MLTGCPEIQKSQIQVVLKADIIFIIIFRFFVGFTWSVIGEAPIENFFDRKMNSYLAAYDQASVTFVSQWL